MTTGNKETENTESNQEVESKLLLEAKAFVEANAVPINTSASRCVDGRYTQEQDPNALAWPGADLGLAMLLLSEIDNETGKLYTAEKVIQKMTEFLKTRGRNFCWHSDSHAKGDKVGCGHFDCACSLNYDNVSAEEYGKLVSEVKKIENANCITLNGDHKEKAILIMPDDWSVPACFGDNQYFVYHAGLYRIEVEALAEFMGLNTDKLWQKAQDQLSKTLATLPSAQGKKMIQVTINSAQGNIVVNAEIKIAKD